MAILNNPHDPIPHKLYSDDLTDIIDLLLTKDPEQRPSIHELTKFPVIRKALDNLLSEFEGKTLFELRNSLNLKEIPVKPAYKVHVPEADSSIKDLSCGISTIEFPQSTEKLYFVYLSGGRLYTEVDNTLFVFSMGDLTSPSATYPLGERCFSGLISDKHLYLGGE